MAFVSQPIAAAATQYTGAAAAGLVTFDLSNFTSGIWVPRIFYAALTVQGPACTAVFAVGLNATAAGNRAELINDVGNSFVLKCPIVLGKAAAADIHQLYVTTTGKNGAGLLEVVWAPYNLLS